ncbi:AAA family ATPase [Nocardia sp. NPDC003482]
MKPNQTMVTPPDHPVSSPAQDFPVPAAFCERFRGALRPVPGEPLWIIHGSGVTDMLVGADLLPRTIEELLWEIFHFAGYERIVYSDYRRPVYFRDRRSRELTRAETDETARRAGVVTTGRFGGPLGRLMLLDTPHSGGTGHERPGKISARDRSTASDPQRLEMIDGLMTEHSVRTAVVVPDAQTWLSDMPVPVHRAAADMFRRWSSGEVGPRNTCVLLFARHEFTAVIDLIRGPSGLPELEDHLIQLGQRAAAPAVTTVGEAAPAELHRVVHYARLMRGLEVGDWAALEHLTQAMAAQRLPVKIWLPNLESFAERRIPLTVDALDDHGLYVEKVQPSGDLWKQLEAMVGLAPVKRFLAEHRALLEAEAALRATGRGGGERPTLHLVFTGNPGTGKTVVARMVAALYRDMGLLAGGHLVAASVDDLVSGYVSGTSERTAAVVRRALDGVLFIDEAYGLAAGHGPEAITRLLTAMEDHRDRLAVIVAGYPDRMAEFLATNEGLASRFPEGNRIEFPDYGPDELHTILMQQLTTEHTLTCTPELVETLRAVVADMHRTRNRRFGNGRTMRELAKDIKRTWASRIDFVPGTAVPPVTVDDLPERYRRYADKAPTLDEVLAELTPLVGLTSVKAAVRQLAAIQQIRREEPGRRSRAAAPHMAFLGSPGTGKTTVATLMGKVFRSLGLLAAGHVVVARRADLVAGYVGQTAPKTREKALEALDGVLFIDEAYELAGRGSQDFGPEAIAELLVLMEEYRERLVVIFAGYTDLMEQQLLLTNPGLASRLIRLDFADYTVPELRLIFERMAAAEGLELAEGVHAKAVRWLEARRQADGARFGNARTVRQLLFDNIEGRRALRLQKVPPQQRDAHTRQVLPIDVPDPEQ